MRQTPHRYKGKSGRERRRRINWSVLGYSTMTFKLKKLVEMSRK
jgi:hypothetical protein